MWDWLLLTMRRKPGMLFSFLVSTCTLLIKGARLLTVVSMLCLNLKLQAGEKRFCISLVFLHKNLRT